MADATPTPETVTCTVDGMEVTVPKGTRILDAAAMAGIDVPHYCYHPALSAPAQCRMCLVEVEKAPKLVPACTGQVMEGNVIHTQSEQALKAREGVLEFYLVNHPLDCPVCDQSGECKLQDYVAAEGPAMGRLKEPKRVLGRDDFGGDVMFYADRCVMCTRCVRFMREVARDERLTVVQRGHRNVIDTFFDEGLDGNLWADNIIDICPVGALVSKDFMHKARAWDLDRTPSVCPNCTQGCNVRLEVRDNQVQRLKPRPNPEVNAHWMCDYGRLNYAWINRGDRIEAPLVRDGDRLVSTSWADALTRLAAALKEATGEARAVVSPFMANEDLGALRRVMDASGGGSGVFRCQTGEVVPLPGFPTLTLREDRAANVAGAELFGFERVGDGEGRGGVEAAAAHAGTLLANEDLGALRRVMDASGGGSGVFRCQTGEVVPLPGFPTLTLREDRAANVAGAELFGFERVGDGEGRGGVEAAAAHAGTLLVLGDEMPDAAEDFGRGASLFVYVGHFLGAAARNAHFILPATTFAEMEGSFTNVQRRVQRFWPALRAPGMARPAWQILGVLLAGISDAGAPASAADAFDGLAAARPEFGRLSWAELGTQGAVLPEVEALQDAGD